MNGDEIHMLRIHETAMDLATGLVPTLARIKRSDSYLEDQLRRALMSVVNNIAEGSNQLGGRRASHYSIALGSAREAWSSLRLAAAFGYIEPAVVEMNRNRFDHIIGTLMKVLPRRAA